MRNWMWLGAALVVLASSACSRADPTGDRVALALRASGGNADVALDSLIVWPMPVDVGSLPDDACPRSEAEQLRMAQELIRLGANARNPDHLMQAGEYDRPQIADLLVRCGARVNSKSDIGATALMTAASHGSAETVRVLLRLGADPTVRDRTGHTALDYARQCEVHGPPGYGSPKSEADRQRYRTMVTELVTAVRKHRSERRRSPRVHQPSPR